MFLFHYLNEDGEIVEWYVNNHHLIDIVVIDGSVYVTTTGTGDDGWLVEETAEDIVRMLNRYWYIYSNDGEVNSHHDEDVRIETEAGI